MRIKLNFFFLCFLTFNLLSCSERPLLPLDDSISIKINFDLDSTIDEINTSGLIRSVSMIHLSDSLPMNNASKIINHDGKYYFLDKKFMSVGVFDSIGNLISSIHKIGNLENQYKQLFDIYIDSNQNHLELLTRVDKKIISYDLNGEKVLNVRRLPTYFTSIVKGDGFFLGYLGNYIDKKSPGNFWVMNENMNFIDGFLKINPNFDSFNSSSIQSFSTFNGEINFIQDFDLNLYTYSNGKVYKKYEFAFGNYNLPNELKSTQKYEKLLPSIKSKYVSNISKFQETSNFLLLNFYYDGKSLIGYYDKNSKRSKVYSANSNTKTFLNPFGRIIGIEGDQVYTIIEANQINRIILNNDKINNFENLYPKQFTQLTKMFGNIGLTDNSNVFLVKYKIN